MKIHISRNTLAFALICGAIGILGGAVGGVAWACDERGPKARESWDLIMVEVEVEGDPRNAGQLEVGRRAELVRGSKKNDDLALSKPSRIFRRVSE